jgi:hypothetical protein
MKYFTNVKTIEELKKEYKKLALKNHPDMGGKVEDMQLINAEFDLFYKSLPKEEVRTAKQYRSEFYTANGWKGTRYHREYTIKDIANFVKSYVKDVYPTWKFSIRTKYFSGGCEIDMAITEVPYQIHTVENIKKYINTSYAFGSYSDEQKEKRIQYYINDFENGKEIQNIKNNVEMLNEKAAYVIKDIEELVQSYNYDDSDAMTDYFDTNFYFHFDLGLYSKEKPWSIVPKTERPTSNKTTKAKKISA